MIRKLAGGKYRIYSRKVDPKTGKRRNLGTFGPRPTSNSTSAKFNTSSVTDRGSSVPDAERLLAAVEDQRHDQVFFVVEVTDQPLDQQAACRRVIVAATDERIAVA